MFFPDSCFLEFDSSTKFRRLLGYYGLGAQVVDKGTLLRELDNIHRKGFTESIGEFSPEASARAFLLFFYMNKLEERGLNDGWT